MGKASLVGVTVSLNRLFSSYSAIQSMEAQHLRHLLLHRSPSDEVYIPDKAPMTVSAT